ncbi:MGMT family protein [Pseudoalteromonas denitrificans]|uniref:Methylated-DNA-protein-cysteine methyltransferase related protein n=1 Tax=Pseudoalteromonas denitrificans DSM 6059 TaxID=1123010 RepID=A0A1I1H1L0_9GAMM|nr:MGMT family protein [Pseudoalteromonas denitrificans]SFC15303.1 methylated-DNA-protein-cysteine methyltransferase related protein [Pseudoalteromonas denitrificans DSM 6059]
MLDEPKYDVKQDQIRNVIISIPVGKVATYGQIAKLAGLAGYARYVGYVLKNLPNETGLPWHRVINAQGRLSFKPGSERYKVQYQKLLFEGITLTNGRINLKKHQWQY